MAVSLDCPRKLIVDSSYGRPSAILYNPGVRSNEVVCWAGRERLLDITSVPKRSAA